MERRWLIIAFAIVIVIWIGWLFGIYSQLPETIPTHFNASGEPNDWGSRATIWILPLVGLFCTGLFLIVPRLNPEYVNYPVKITEENRERQWKNMVIMMYVTAGWTLALFIFISWVSVRMSLGEPAPSLAWIWGLIGGIFATMGVAIYRSFKLK